MNIKMIYPNAVQFAIIDGDSVVFHSDIISDISTKVVEVIDETTLKLKISGRVFNKYILFVHDGNFGAFCSYGNCVLYHHNSDLGFYKLPNYNSLYLEVSKNACSTVVSEIYNHFYAENEEDKISTNDWVWEKFALNDYKRAKCNLEIKDFSKSDQYNCIFMVYDDPVKRFARALNNKYLEQHTILSFIEQPYDKNISIFIDKALLITRLNIMNKNSWDQHIVPISIYHKDTLKYVTDFVYIEDLASFMIEKFNISPKKYYVSKSRVITKDVFNQKQLKTIKKIYEEDYQIPIIYKDKFYTPSK